MALTTAALDAMATELAGLVTHVSLHTADPGATGASETTAARVPVTWTVAANGDIEVTAALEFTGGTASGTVTHVGLQGAVTGGTFYGSSALTGDATFSSTGEYTVTALTVPGSSS